MHGSNLGFQVWAMAFYFPAPGIKGTASMKLHRDLGISQKSTCHLAHRIRETWSDAQPAFAEPVEADETYIGGREINQHSHRTLRAGRGKLGKIPVAGVKDRKTEKVSAAVVPDMTKKSLQGLIHERTTDGAMVYTDEWHAYKGLPNHQPVKHGIGNW